MSGSVVFDRAADYYDATRGFPPGEEQRAADLMAQAGGLTAEHRVLEIGVGTGRIALPLARHVRSIDGIDLSTRMLARLQAKRTDERVRVTQGDITRLPYRTGGFDALVAVHIFHLVSGWREALTEAARVLKPGGVLLHAWTEQDNDPEFDRIWREATGSGRASTTGIPWAERKTLLEENGWTPITDVITYRYPVQRPPQSFVDALKGRMWSHTWTMPDDELARGIAAVQAYIERTYADPTQPATFESLFQVRAYRVTV